MRSTKESAWARGACKGMEASKSMKISEVMKPDDVLVRVSAPSKSKLLRFLSENAASALGLDKDDIFGALQNRESLGSTGIGAGIAIPHAPVAGVTSPYALLVRLAKPIEFKAIDEEPVDVVCLILTPPGEQNRYLKLLSSVARQLRSPEAVETIRHAAEREQVYHAITACDR
jgi:nitrogen PTS system EIIA component